MARIRTIKPDFFLDEGLAEVSHAARLLFIGLWCLADKDGRLEDRPKYIGAQVFPYDKIDIDGLLSKLNGEWIVRYEVDGKKLIQIINFTKHQRVGNREPESTLPPCEADLSTLKQTKEEVEGKGREGKGNIVGQARRWIDILNQSTGQSYRYGDADLKHVKARINEGFTEDDCRKVCESRAADWKGSDMERFLRPETLFGSKFDSYLQACKTSTSGEVNPFARMLGK